MKTITNVLFVLLMGLSCNKENATIELKPLEPYVKNLITADTSDPYLGEYYIRVNYVTTGPSQGKELMFSETDQDMTIWYYPSDSGLGMSEQGVILCNRATSESLEVTFHFNIGTDTSFYICYGNYMFADPWRNGAGANIGYIRPVDSTDPSTCYFFLGTNTADSFFNITYIGKNRINGTFKTIWKECCTGPQTYNVYGEFSIPSIYYTNSMK